MPLNLDFGGLQEHNCACRWRTSSAEDGKRERLTESCKDKDIGKGMKMTRSEDDFQSVEAGLPYWTAKEDDGRG